jgi:hypothetical protein
MANPFFDALGGGNTPVGRFQQMMQQFNQFRASFQGDPKAEVEKLLQSGKMSQRQLNQLQEMAKQFQGFIK